mgnify:CR=1 FL=1|jgi:hypothetical protein
MKIILRKLKKPTGSISYEDVFQQYGIAAANQDLSARKSNPPSSAPTLGDQSRSNDLLSKHKTNPNPRRKP